MQALSDEQQIERLEHKVDRLDAKIDQKVDALDAKIDQKVDALDAKIDQRLGGLDAKIENVRIEARADHRTLLGIQLTTLVAMVLGFAGILLQHHL